MEAEKKTFALGIIQRLLFHCSVCDGLRCVFLPVCKEAGMEAHASLACMISLNVLVIYKWLVADSIDDIFNKTAILNSIL